jgi:hypothetical protein
MPEIIPNIEGAMAVPKPEPITQEQRDYLTAKVVAAITTDLRTQGAFDGPDRFDVVFRNLAPRLTPNWDALLFVVKRAAKLYHRSDSQDE